MSALDIFDKRVLENVAQLNAGAFSLPHCLTSLGKDSLVSYFFVPGEFLIVITIQSLGHMFLVTFFCARNGVGFFLTNFRREIIEENSSHREVNTLSFSSTLT